MSFQTTFPSALVATAVVSASILASAPAEAANIAVGSTIQFSNIRRVLVSFEETDTTGKLNFDSRTVPFIGTVQPIAIDSGTGSFETFDLFARILDVPLENKGGGLFSLSAPVDNFLSFINLPPIWSGFNDVQFTLTKFDFNRNIGRTTALEGFFIRDGHKTPGVGAFSSQLTEFEPSTWSMSIEAVPTPALLPGLIGMGVAALRRKKDEEVAEEHA
jgi:hypothetical protein